MRVHLLPLPASTGIVGMQPGAGKAMTGLLVPMGLIPPRATSGLHERSSLAGSLDRALPAPCLAGNDNTVQVVIDMLEQGRGSLQRCLLALAAELLAFLAIP